MSFEGTAGRRNATGIKNGFFFCRPTLHAVLPEECKTANFILMRLKTSAVIDCDRSDQASELPHRPRDQILNAPGHLKPPRQTQGGERVIYILGHNSISS